MGFEAYFDVVEKSKYPDIGSIERGYEAGDVDSVYNEWFGSTHGHLLWYIVKGLKGEREHEVWEITEKDFNDLIIKIAEKITECKLEKVNIVNSITENEDNSITIRECDGVEVEFLSGHLYRVFTRDNSYEEWELGIAENVDVYDYIDILTILIKLQKNINFKDTTETMYFGVSY